LLLSSGILELARTRNVKFRLTFRSYHISLDHSETVRYVTCQADYLSIVAPLLGTTLSSTHFGFRCEQHLQAVYRPLAIFFALMCAVATLHPVFSNPTGHRVRTAVYCLLGVASSAPIVHGVLLHGVKEHDQAMSLGWYVALGCCHATGAAFYAVKWPERWYSRTFDLLGSSHQLMHILVVCGAACYSVDILKAFEQAQGRVC
jgi:adiponectin receptor